MSLPDAARWLAEALESGNPLAELPPDIAPASVEDGEEVAFAVLEQLGIAPVGLRLLLRPGAAPLAGPMIEGRLLRSGAPVALAGLRRASATAAAIGVLAEPLGEAPPVLGALHAAIDVAASRFSREPDVDALLAADLARLGMVVAGRGRALAPGAVTASLAAKGATRRQPVPCDLAAAFDLAAAAARRLGGLPQGALLVVAGLTPAVPAEGMLSAAMGPLGRVEATFSPA